MTTQEMLLVVPELCKPKGNQVMRRFKLACGHQSGLTMIEILVTLVIVSVGLLGAAAMVINGLEHNRNAYLRTQASLLAYDMADRIRGNPDQAEDYNGFSFDAEASNGPPEVPSCYSSDKGCKPDGMVNVDTAQWASALAKSDGGVALLPEATGTVTQNGDEFVITITWGERPQSESDGDTESQSQSFALTFNL